MGILLSKSPQWRGVAEYLKRAGIRCSLKRDRIVVRGYKGSRIIVSRGLDVQRLYSPRYKTLYIDYNSGLYRLRSQAIDIPETTRLFRLAYLIKTYLLIDLPYRLSRLWVYRDDGDGDIDIVIRN